MRRRDDNGTALITVLAVAAIGSFSVVNTFNKLDSSAANFLLSHDAAAAQTLLVSLENSVSASLFHDSLVAGDADSLAEPWATETIQEQVSVAGATVTLRLEDAEAKYNLSNLSFDSALGSSAIDAFVSDGLFSRDAALRVKATMKSASPPKYLFELGSKAGLTSSEIAMLKEFATILPSRTTLNLNTASGQLVKTVIGDDDLRATKFLDLREEKSLLKLEDLLDLGIILPASAQLSSKHIISHIQVKLGDTKRVIRTSFYRSEKLPPMVYQRNFYE